jgi:uncharacterized small protein (DUF1192 family)
MDKLQKLSVNVETGEETLIDLTPEEVAEFEIGVKALQDEKAEIEAKIKSDEAAKLAAEAKLAALGLTTDDLKALGLGGN